MEEGALSIRELEPCCLVHPWRPPLSDEAGTTLVILPVFASLLTVLIPWAPPCPALMLGGSLRFRLSLSQLRSFLLWGCWVTRSLSQNCFHLLLACSQEHDLCKAILHPTRAKSCHIALSSSSLPFWVHDSDGSNCRGWRKAPLLQQR